jgi:hypothetical protein
MKILNRRTTAIPLLAVLIRMFSTPATRALAGSLALYE